MTIMPLITIIPLAFLGYRKTRPRSSDLKDDYEIFTAGANATGKIRLEATFPQLIHFFKEFTNITPWLTLEGVLDDKIMLSRRWNLWTLGERLTVSMTQVQQGHSLVTIHIEPKLKTTVYDWGNAKRDLRVIFKSMKEQFGAKAPPGPPQAVRADIE